MYFPIVLIHFVSNRSLQAAVGGDISLLAAEEPVFGSSERFRFIVKSASDKASLFKELKSIRNSDTMCCVIVVSDELTTSDVQAGIIPNDITKDIRREFLETDHLCGLVALAPGATRRILDVDRFVDSNAFDLKTLKTAILKTANGLRLKAPPNPENLLSENDAIKIIVVQSEQQLQECLHLRFQIYDLMGYLADEISLNPFEVEMDSFDLNSIHFIAVSHQSGQIAGTTRLVVSQVPRHERTLIGNPKNTVLKLRNWCESIARKRGTDALRKRLESPYFLPLPILQSSDFRGKWKEVLEESSQGGEISRVVVPPKYRGMGVSKLMMRAAIATAYSIGKEFLLLECIPRHTKMYEKYGFKPMGGHHNRVQELDQVAVGMRLQLEDRPDNYAAQMAKCDISMVEAGTDDGSMLSGTKHLCLCRNRRCWSQGGYDFRSRIACPLRCE